MSEPQVPNPAPRPTGANRAIAVGGAVLFFAMAALGAYIWRDLDHRIAAAKQIETKTGKPVGPDLLKSPRTAAAEAKAAGAGS